MKDVQLKNDSFIAALTSSGGLCKSLVFLDKNQIPHQIFRPQEIPEYKNQIPHFGCFPMVPFCNRLQKGRLTLGETEVLFPQNWPEEGNSIHGTGCESDWNILNHQFDEIEMCHNWKSADELYSFEAIQKLRLHNDCAKFGIQVYNTAQRPLPIGVGFHPWFSFSPDMILDLTDVLIQQSAITAVSKNWKLLDGSTVIADLDGLDACYAYNGGDVEVRIPSNKLRLIFSISSSFSHLQFFVSKSLNSFCIEPVSHGVGELEQKKHFVDPGKYKTASMDLKMERLHS